MRIAKRKLHETWRDAVSKRARDVRIPAALDAFDAMVRAGSGEAEAAYRALAEHELLWPISGPEPMQPAADRPAPGSDAGGVPDV